ncbi:MAG: hypothetical protein P8Y58_08630, partial [Novosphingobium sp.]
MAQGRFIASGADLPVTLDLALTDLVIIHFERFDPLRDRRSLLIEMAQEVAGVYVPAFYREQYGEDGTLKSFAPVEAVPEKIKRVYA